jgi:hypothetical protein
MALPYTPEFLESLRRRYEETRESLNSIGAEFGLDPQTVSRIARRAGWRMRSAMRHLPEHVRLAEAVKQSAHSRASGNPAWVPAFAGTSGEVSGVSEQATLKDMDARNKCGHDEEQLAGSDSSALARLEKQVLRELEIEEAQRAALGTTPRPPAEAAHKARAYASLLQTIQAIERARSGEPLPAGHPDESLDPAPHDIDEFRLALARRIETFVASRTDAGHAEGSGEAGMVDPAR